MPVTSRFVSEGRRPRIRKVLGKKFAGFQLAYAKGVPIEGFDVFAASAPVPFCMPSAVWFNARHADGEPRGSVKHRGTCSSGFQRVIDSSAPDDLKAA
jgi:hypothetical protein